MAYKIEYENKESVRLSGYPDKNSILASDLNEIKTKFNALVDEFNELEFENFATGNLLFDDDHTHNLAGHSCTLTNVDYFAIDGPLRLGGIGNTGALIGAKGVDNSASTYLVYLSNIDDDILLSLVNSGKLVASLGNFTLLPFGGDTYQETTTGYGWFRANGYGTYNVNLTGGVNFESTNYGGNVARPNFKVQIEPPSNKVHLGLPPKTGASVSAMTWVTADKGAVVMIEGTDATFTSDGIWRYTGSAWVFVG